jgi:hypothetical protein
LCSSKAQKKQKVFFVVFFGKIFPKNTTCGTSHQVHVGSIPVIVIRQPDKHLGRSFSFAYLGEQLPNKLSKMRDCFE